MTEVEWHTTRKKPNGSFKRILVTVKDEFGRKYVTVGVYVESLDAFSVLEQRYQKIIAWAELPKPYKEPEPLDMHHDAIVARRYMENHK